MRLESPAFVDGAQIPKRHGYRHGNASVPLTIHDIPQNCASLALIMDDPDAVGAVGKVWVHWTVWNIEADTAKIAESSVPAGAIQGTTDFGEARYGGPAPPDRPHTYLFKLYALDTRLELEAGSHKTALENAMKGHILAETTLRGTFAP